MTRANIILADSLFVLSSGMIYETDGLKKYPIILAPFLIIAFVSCVVRHINYYNMTNKIY
ncbi:MAG: hypothetical protein ACXVJE_24105 [Mucilaginibacter sp.]